MLLDDIFNNPRVAAIASKGLSEPQSLSLDEIRAVCSTALSHVPDHRQKYFLKSRPYHEQVAMMVAAVRYQPQLNEETDVPQPSKEEGAVVEAPMPGVAVKVVRYLPQLSKVSCR